MLEALDKYDDYKVMILHDHATPLSLRTHTNDPVPFMIYKKSVDGTETSVSHLSEETAKATGLFIHDGNTLMKFFIEL